MSRISLNSNNACLRGLLKTQMALALVQGWREQWTIPFRTISYWLVQFQLLSLSASYSPPLWPCHWSLFFIHLLSSLHHCSEDMAGRSMPGPFLLHTPACGKGLTDPSSLWPSSLSSVRWFFRMNCPQRRWEQGSRSTFLTQISSLRGSCLLAFIFDLVSYHGLHLAPWGNCFSRLRSWRIPWH